jgi:hypothetical protein
LKRSHLTKMARNPWPAQAASVIVLPSGERGQKLLDIAKSWSQSGILGQALWILPSDDLSSSHGLAIQAQIFGRENTVTVDLFQQLAQSPLKKLRIIAVRLLAKNDDVDELQDLNIKALDSLAQVGVPLVTTNVGIGANGTKVFRINMIMAPSWLEEVKHRSLTEKVWTHNVIISPEDRTSPWGIDAFVREETNLYGITLANIASAGGLWMGAPVGTFEMREHNLSGTPGQIWLQRTFARGVLTEGLAVEQAVKAMESAANPDVNLLRPEFGLQPQGIALLPESRVQEKIDWMLGELFKLEGGALNYKKYSGANTADQIRWGFGKQLSEFFKFSWDKTKMIPVWTWRAIVGWMSKKFTKIFQGSDGNAVVDARIDFKMNLDDSDQAIDAMIFDLNRIKSEALKGKVGKVTSTSVRATPQLWEKIRTLLFAMLDGSAGPVGIELEKKEDRQYVFGRLGDLVFDPESEWHLQPGFTVPEGVDAQFVQDRNVIDWENLLEGKVLLDLTQKEIHRVEEELVKLQSNVEKPVQESQVPEVIPEPDVLPSPMPSEVAEVTERPVEDIEPEKALEANEVIEDGK